tara:strand:+ start:24596 stop:25444 length:849 start_codon:yes stop_codon:yes gene_type:complete
MKFLKKYPRLYNFLKDFKSILREALAPSKAAKFKGWYGMTLYTDPPWISTDLKQDSLEHQFKLVDIFTKNSVEDGSMKLIQFDHYNLDTIKILSELTWRHYIVFWSSYYAARNTKSNIKGMVEVGVADGLTLNYAFHALECYGFEFHGYLYDTWDEVVLENPSTKGTETQYDYLDINTTKSNLKKFEEKLTFKQGFIPDTFTGDQEPETISWLHIDLNSSPPTLDTLNYYWDRLESGGVVLFDDYAQPAYIDTKRAVDVWLLDKTDGVILQIPSSQAIIFKV